LGALRRVFQPVIAVCLPAHPVGHLLVTDSSLILLLYLKGLLTCPCGLQSSTDPRRATPRQLPKLSSWTLWGHRTCSNRLVGVGAYLIVSGYIPRVFHNRIKTEASPNSDYWDDQGVYQESRSDPSTKVRLPWSMRPMICDMTTLEEDFVQPAKTCLLSLPIRRSQ
jgi:hypothetical protein